MTTDLQIETSRLIIRTVTMADIEDVAQNWQLYDGPISRAEAENQIARMRDNYKATAAGNLTHLCLAIIEKDTQDFIGWCGLDHRDPTTPSPVLFYLLKTESWGRGLATEAARALLDYALTALGQTRIDGRTALENIASKRVMEKIGMQYLGTDDDGHAFTLTRTEQH